MTDLSLFDSIADFEENVGISYTGKQTLLAVSGGKDSILLFHYFLHKKRSFAVAHCNYQLRGEASKLDEELVRNLCNNYRVPFFLKRFETKQLAEEAKQSIQMKARELRFNFFNEICIEKSFDYIALGSNATDALETFFIHQLRGSGIAGLAGIYPKRNHLLRPLLCLNSTEIRNFCEKNQFIYREDESNQNDYYLRNKLRHHLIPAIKEIAPQFEEIFLQNSLKVQQGIDLLNDSANTLIEKYIQRNEQRISISKQMLQEKHASYLCFHFLSQYGFNSNQIKSIQTQQLQVGKCFYSKNFKLNIEREAFVVKPYEEKIHNQCFVCHNWQEIAQLPFIKTAVLKDFESGILQELNHHQVGFNIDNLQFPLLFRIWEKGDKIQPLGMKGSKLISDILTDAKVANEKRNAQWVMLSDNKIKWLVGLRVADDSKIENTAKKILIIHLNEPK